MSQLKFQQVLVPKQVYIGDRAEIRCSFNSASQELKEVTKEGPAKLDFDTLIQGQEARALLADFDVKEVSLSPAGVDFYQLTISFVPWKTGEVTLPTIFLGEDILELQPVNIVSLVESQKQTILKEETPPILLPGTTYKIYSLIIIILVLTFLIIRLIIKRQSVSFFIKNLLLTIKCKHSRRQTEKKLQALRDQTTSSDKVWAESVQKIIRKYLSVKFQFDFSQKTSSEIYPTIMKLTAGLLEEKNESLARIVEIFIRTDYIRYSSDNKLLDSERNQLTDDLLKAISTIEKKPEKKGENQNA
ncbi:MAG: hypothetical protein K5681_06975 [Treponema sp.]|nr:hypothetical protein [Treponema sp.]